MKHRIRRILPILRPAAAPAALLASAVPVCAGGAFAAPSEVTAQVAAPTQAAARRHVGIETEVGTLAGTLHLPVGAGPHPAVVMVQGAGDTGRDAWPYRPVAEHLAASGYAALVYDKRGLADSQGGYDEAEDLYALARDAAAALATARAQPEVDSARVGFWGRSQGAWVVAAAAELSDEAAFLILEVGGGVSGLEQNVFARQRALAHRGVPPSDRQLIERAQRSVWTYYATGEGEADARKAVAAAREAGVLPAYADAVPGVPRGSPLPGPEWVAANADGTLRWFRRHLTFDPIPHLLQLDIPVLAVFGGADRLTPTDASVTRLRDAAFAGARSELLTVRTFAGADHGLCPQTPGEPIVMGCTFVAGYPEVLTEWLDRIPSDIGPRPAAARQPLVAGGGFAGTAMEACETDVRRINQVSGWTVRWPRALTDLPVASADEQHAALAYWAEAPAALEADVAALRRGMRSGTSAPRPVVHRVLAQVDALLATPEDESPLWSPARRSPDAGFADTWSSMVRDSFLPALRSYRAFLAEEYLPAAREASGLVATPGGAACYARLIERWTSLSLPPAEVEEMGRRELARLREELLRRAAPRFGTTVDEVLRTLREDELPDPFRSRDEVVRHAEAAVARAKAVVGEWIETPADVPIRVEAMPRFMESSFPAGFYRGPGADGVAVYVVNTSRPAERRLLSEAIAFHEAIPGHHTHATARSPGGDFVSGLAEGWAIYAETLAEEMGLYSSELDEIGRITKHLWATSRLIVEPGIHVRGWSRDRAVRFMLDNTALPRDEVELEVDRYMALPGQSLSYMLGNLHLRELRRAAEQELGDRFDIRAFHDVILQPGMRPLPEVSRDVRRWAAELD